MSEAWTTNRVVWLVGICQELSAQQGLYPLQTRRWRLQYLTHFLSEQGGCEGFLKEEHPGLNHSMVNNCVIGIARHEKNLDLWSQELNPG